MAQSTQVTKKTYNDVINKVIHNCRDAFLDEGMDEHTLQDLKRLWVEKLNASKALVDRVSYSEKLSSLQFIFHSQRPPQTQPRYVYQNASGQTFTQVRPQMVHSNQPQQVQRVRKKFDLI